MTPEGAVKKAIKPVLKDLGAWYFMPVPSGYANNGIPDFVCCVPYQVRPEDVGRIIGMFVAVEAKAEGKAHTTTVLQDKALAGIGDAYGVALVTDTAEGLTVRIVDGMKGL